jgi:ATPase subunit of ABC transporter with duplicated ATPase domains
MIISHDRWFLDRIATHILSFEGEGKVEWFEGNYSEYAEYYHKMTGTELEQANKKVKYKKLLN